MTDTAGTGRGADASATFRPLEDAAPAGEPAARTSPQRPDDHASRAADHAETQAQCRSASALTDEEVLDRLRELAREKGGALTERDLAGTGAPSRDAMRRRFGSWREALDRAGLKAARGSQRYSDEECFANMALLWRHYGRPPRVVDANRPPSQVGSAAYLRRAGTWKRALAAYAAFTGNDTRRGPVGRLTLPSIGDEGDATGDTTGDATGDAMDDAMDCGVRAREPGVADAAPGRAVPGTSARGGGSRRSGHKTPLSLRFQVLQRDRFRCTACGNSPAADPQCRLHADHIVPQSAGGRTEAGNLRSLCAACNLGRGNRALPA